MKVSGQFHVLAALSPGKDPGTRWVRGWVDSKAACGGEDKKKFFRAPAGNRTLVQWNKAEIIRKEEKRMIRKLNELVFVRTVEQVTSLLGLYTRPI
jgi:hypothetical protein